MKISAVILLFVALVFSSCDVSLKPINYGEDQCGACKMIISDKRFGAELVTHKGKVFKYDAAECMFRDLAKYDVSNYKHIGVTHFRDPGKLKDGLNSSYLISKKIPSPMGGFLSAYASNSNAQKMVSDNLDSVYSFSELLDLFVEGEI